MHKVNISLQLLPWSAAKHPYDIVDKAIDIIRKSGIKFRVTPFETVMEGDYDIIMGVIKNIQEECLKYGADNLLSFVKIQVSRDHDITIEDKTGKYD
ncbi:MAG: thiamine-binding protein [Clostridiaceae bacterium]|nr:thiamine-binding protein [Clostridiaceae bacterium]